MAQLATNFPENLDNLTNPTSTDSLEGHAQQHSNVNDAIEAIQTKVGINGSNNPNSLDYKINDLVTIVGGLNNSTDNISTLLGLDGNNDLVISGIENKTVIDSFALSLYRSADYKVQISKGSEYYFAKIAILSDGTHINVSESDIISNTNNNLANITFEENSGIISLCVTPVSSAVTVRYFRTALKA